MTIIDRILVALWLKPARVDVAVLLDDLAVRQGRTDIDWRHSVVDLMTLLDLDPSYENRVQLAQELGHVGLIRDSTEMDTWLHREIMRRVAENGGTVPEELKE